MTYTTSSNSLVLWFTSANGKTGAAWDFHQRFAAEVVDEHGCGSADQSQASMTSGNDPTLHLATFAQFPRRQATIRVRLRPRSAAAEQNAPVIEFEVPNPVRGPFPAWTPEPLPTARTNGELVFVLKNTSNSAAGPAWSEPQIDILRGALPVEDWDRDAVYVSEATGNRGLHPFCTNESAWKLDVEFVRNAEAEFLPSELFTITNLTAPASGVAVVLTNTFSIQGKPFALCAIAGPGQFVYSNSVLTTAKPPLNGKGETSHCSTTYQGATPIETISVHRSTPHLALVVPPLTGDERLLLRVRAAGVARKLALGPSYSSVSTFPLSGVANPGPFDLDVIVQRVRRAEFMVKPPGK